MHMKQNQFVQLGSRKKSQSKSKNFRQSESTCMQSKQKPFIPTQNNSQSRIIKINYTSKQPFYPCDTQPVSHIRVNKQTFGFDNISNLNTSRETSNAKRKQLGNHMNPGNLGIRIISREGSPITQSRHVVINELERSSSQRKNLVCTLAPSQVKSTVQKSNSTYTQLQMNLLSKVQSLQQLLSKKSIKFQQVQIQLNQANKKLLHHNNQLRTQLQTTKSRLTQIEQMLEAEISKSLSLMDDKQALINQIEQLKTQLLVKEVLCKTLEGEVKQAKQDVKTKQAEVKHLIKLNEDSTKKLMVQKELITCENKLVENNFQQKVRALQETLVKLNEKLSLKQRQIIQMTLSYNNSLEQVKKQRQSQVNDLKVALEWQKRHQEQLKMENRTLSTQNGSRLQPGKQCQKCKDLLKTVFKLNSYLNKK